MVLLAPNTGRPGYIRLIDSQDGCVALIDISYVGRIGVYHLRNLNPSEWELPWTPDDLTEAD